MKYSSKSLLLILFFPLLVGAQDKSNPNTSRQDLKSQAKVYLDSAKIDLNKTWFDPGNIESISVIKDPAAFIGDNVSGKIFITSKVKDYHWVRLNDLDKNRQDLSPGARTAFVIDGKLITDTANVLIEQSVIESIDILKGATAQQTYPEANADLVVVIITKPDSHLK